MDHLPKLAKPLRPLPYLQVPYLCAKVEYPAAPVGYEQFKSFPTKYRLSFEELQRGDWSLHDSHHILALLQSWLFFGVLTETFSGAGILFNQEEFRRSDVRNSLRTVPDVVDGHAMAIGYLVKGIGDGYSIGKVNPQATEPRLRPARLPDQRRPSYQMRRHSPAELLFSTWFG